MKLNRGQVYGLFLSHLDALHITIERFYASYCVQVHIPPERESDRASWRALILARSSDYWQQRVHLRRTSRPDLVICYEHDTCLPCAVLPLDEGWLYHPCELPHWYAPQMRGTKRGCMVLLGQLLSGDERGFKLFDDLPRTTRYRYLAKLRHFSHNRRGRPLVA
jgi:hypothetical protein